LKEKIVNLNGIPKYYLLIETIESEKDDDETEQVMEM
jgi:hypothetical protein